MGILIQDGKVIQGKKTPMEEIRPEEVPKKKHVTPALYVIETRRIPNLPVKITFPPSYIVDENYGSDLGNFIHWLKFENKTDRTITEYQMNLRYWKKRLHGSIDVEKIKGVVDGCTERRQRQILVALRAYAQYRVSIGDFRLNNLIASIQHWSLKPKSSEKMERLSEKELEMYRRHARDLCKHNDRDGIWMGLLLIGISAGEIGGMDYNGNGTGAVCRRKKIKKFRIPTWLGAAMKTVPEHKWRLGRQAIHKGVSEYGTNPRTIFNSVIRK